MISVIIISFNTSSLLRHCLSSLFQYSPGVELEVFVVDNNSSDDSVEMVKNEFPQVNLMVNRENRGFAAANNQAWRKSSGEYVLLLNPDAFIKKDSIRNAVDFMESHPTCGICGGRLVKPDGNLDPSARKFPKALTKFFTLSGLRSRFPRSSFVSDHEFGNFDHRSVVEVDWVPGTFTMYRRQMLKETGLFDERFFIYFEETDLCKHAKKAGWKVYFIPSAEVIHIGGASSKTRKEHIYDAGALQVLSFRMRSEWLYFRKNNGLLAVIANAGVEAGWHILRWFFNWLPGKSQSKQKRRISASILRELILSLKVTRLGRYSPPAPW